MVSICDNPQSIDQRNPYTLTFTSIFEQNCLILTLTMSRQLISSEKFPPKPHNCKSYNRQTYSTTLG